MTASQTNLLRAHSATNAQQNSGDVVLSTAVAVVIARARLEGPFM